MCERIKDLLLKVRPSLTWIEPVDPVIRHLKEYLNKPSNGPSVLYSKIAREPSPAGKKLIAIEKGNIRHSETVTRVILKEEPAQAPPWSQQGYEEGVAKHGAIQTLFEAARQQKKKGIDQKGESKV